MSFVLSGALCMACGGAKDVDLFDPPRSAPASAAPLIGAGAGTSGGGASGGNAAETGGASTVTLDPSLPAAGAPAAAAAGAAPTDGGAPVTMRSLVDDMEALVSSIPETDGRMGYWYTFNDGEGGTQLPAPNGPFLPDLISGSGFPGSTRARHTQGTGFSSYAGFGFDLNNRAGKRQTYDASSYGGIVLWLRGTVHVRVLFPTRATAPTTEGGDCTSSCNDSFGLDVTPTDGWSEQTVPFAALHQLSSTSGLSFDPKTLLGIAFSVQVGGAFDVWVDELGFY